MLWRDILGMTQMVTDIKSKFEDKIDQKFKTIEK